MSRAGERVQVDRIQKSKRGNAGKKRSGNNLYGSKGKPKCNACRVARRACEFKSTNDTCANCVRRGLKCGEKTRRGGAQDTVRISVLEQLAVDNRGWTLLDVIAHLKGNDGLLIMASSPETDYSELPHQLPCDQSFEPFDILDYVHGLNHPQPLNMEFAPSGGPPPPLEVDDCSDCTEPVKQENASLFSHEPQLPIDPNFLFNTPIPSTPQWPTALNTFFPLQFATYSNVNVPLFPSSQVSSIETEWLQLPQGSLGDL